MKTKKFRHTIRAVPVIFLALAAGLIAVHLSCGRPGYNVLLITMDTTRADHLRCYGATNIETPTLNSIAREGVLFKHAYAQLPMTLPAHTSILSGDYPLYHGVVDNGGYRVPDDLNTLPKILSKKGYATAAFISAAVLKKNFNLNQGFDYWNEEDIQEQKEMTALVAERKGNLTTDAVLKWLDANYKKKWFMWVHYYDPHREYDPPPPFRQLYYFDEYSGEIAFMDSQIKRLLQFLEDNKIKDKTIIIAIADHGESLGEHGEMTHGIYIFTGTTHIPFLVRVPGLKSKGRALNRVVGQVDVMPTILDFLGLPIPTDIQGQSLKKLILGQEQDSPAGEAFTESHFPLLHYGWSELYGLFNSQYQYIQAPKPELYDLTKDPAEAENLAGKNPKLIKEFDYKVEQIKKSSKSKFTQEAKSDVEMDETTKEQLRDLGYVAGNTRVDLEKAKTKNPSDYSNLISILSSMQNDSVAGRYKLLLEKSDQVLDEDPDNTQALRMKENAYFGMGQYDMAISWVKLMLQKEGETADWYSLLGSCYLREDNIEDAQKAFEQAVKLAVKKDVNDRYYLARIYLRQGKAEDALKLFADEKMKEGALGHLVMAAYYQAVPGREGKAEAEFELALEAAPKNSLAKIEYAQYLLKAGKFKKGLEMLQDAEKKEPSFKADARVQELKKQLTEAVEKGT